MFSLFTNKNIKVLEAIKNYYSDKTYVFPYKSKEIDDAKKWYICNNSKPDLVFILQMMAVKSQLGMNNFTEYL